MRIFSPPKFATWPLIPLLLVVAGCTSPSDSAAVPSAGAGDAPAAGAVVDDAALRDRLDRMIDFTLNKRRLNTTDHCAWQVVHGIVCYGKDLQIAHDGQLVGALDYLLHGGELKGWLMRRTDHGIGSVVEGGSKSGQGHEDQWLGYMSLTGLQPDEQLIVNGETYTVNDMVTEAQWHLYDGIEATWALMAFAAYLPLDAKWKAQDGGDWTIDRVVGMEADQNILESTCGGTHRLVGLATAVNRYKKEHGDKLTGPWLKADQKIKECIDAARRFQQPNGSFSTKFFDRPGDNPEVNTRIHATGHTLEFVVVAGSDAQIREPWVTRAVVQMLDMLEDSEDLSPECGGLYHAVRRLKVYRERRFGPPNGGTGTPPGNSAVPADNAAPGENAAAGDGVSQQDAPSAAASDPRSSERTQR